MSKNIFEISDYGNIRKRILQIESDNVRCWGRMSLEQMLAHCSIQLKLATGLIAEQRPESSFLYRTAAGRWLSLYIIPWPKGFETPSAMDMFSNNAEVRDFETEKALLLRLLELVSEKDELSPHPFYGRLGKKDWGRLIWVHLDHHLRQFSA